MTNAQKTYASIFFSILLWAIAITQVNASDVVAPAQSIDSLYEGKTLEETQKSMEQNIIDLQNEIAKNEAAFRDALLSNDETFDRDANAQEISARQSLMSEIQRQKAQVDRLVEAGQGSSSYESSSQLTTQIVALERQEAQAVLEAEAKRTPYDNLSINDAKNQIDADIATKEKEIDRLLDDATAAQANNNTGVDGQPYDYAAAQNQINQLNSEIENLNGLSAQTQGLIDKGLGDNNFVSTDNLVAQDNITEVLANEEKNIFEYIAENGSNIDEIFPPNSELDPQTSFELNQKIENDLATFCGDNTSCIAENNDRKNQLLDNFNTFETPEAREQFYAEQEANRQAEIAAAQAVLEQQQQELDNRAASEAQIIEDRIRNLQELADDPIYNMNGEERKDRLGEVNAELESVQSQIDSIERNAEQSADGLSADEAQRINNLMNRRAELNDEKTKLENLPIQEQQNVFNLNEDERQDRINSIDEQIDEARDELDSIDRLSEQGLELDDSELARQSELKNQIRDLNAEKENLQTAPSTRQEAKDAELLQMTNQINNLNGQRDALLAQYPPGTEIPADIQNQVSALDAQINSLEANKQILEQTPLELYGSGLSLGDTNRIGDINNTIDTLKDERNALNAKAELTAEEQQRLDYINSKIPELENEKNNIAANPFSLGLSEEEVRQVNGLNSRIDAINKEMQDINVICALQGGCSDEEFSIHQDRYAQLEREKAALEAERDFIIDPFGVNEFAISQTDYDALVAAKDDACNRGFDTCETLTNHVNNLAGMVAPEGVTPSLTDFVLDLSAVNQGQLTRLNNAANEICKRQGDDSAACQNALGAINSTSNNGNILADVGRTISSGLGGGGGGNNNSDGIAAGSFFSASNFSFEQMYRELIAAANKLETLIVGIAYVIGIALVFRGVAMYRIFANQTFGSAQRGELAGPLVFLIVGAIMITLPTAIDTSMVSLFGSSAINVPTGLFAYTSISGTERWERIAELVVRYLWLIGLIAFVRGWVILSKMGHSGSQPGSVGKGITHLVGGVLLLNIVDTTNIIAYTLGYTR